VCCCNNLYYVVLSYFFRYLINWHVICYADRVPKYLKNISKISQKYLKLVLHGELDIRLVVLECLGLVAQQVRDWLHSRSGTGCGTSCTAGPGLVVELAALWN